MHLAVNGMLSVVPNMVVTGINHGSNLGDEVIYSGTVAAAIEGRFLSLPGIAVSLAGGALTHFATAARVAKELVRHTMRYPLSGDTLLNVNVPDIPLAEIQGIRVTQSGSHLPSKPIIPLGQVDGDMLYRISPSGEVRDSGPGSDIEAVKQGFVSVTPIQINLTRERQVSAVSQWTEGVSLTISEKQ